MKRNAMESIRVRLQFGEDEKYWLFIDLKKMKTIQDVIEDVNDKYSIVCDKLFLDDAQLFCKETVSVLQDKDLIRVCLKDSKRKKDKVKYHEVPKDAEKQASLSPPPEPKKKKKSKDICEEQNLNSIVVPEETLILPSKPKKKRKHQELDEHQSHEVIPDPITHQLTSVKESGTKKQSKVTSVDKEIPSQCESVIELQSETEEVETSVTEHTSEVKRKRRRRKRKSNHSKSPVMDDPSLVNYCEPVQTYIPLESKTRQHVRFGDDSDVENEAQSQLNSFTNGSHSLIEPKPKEGYEETYPCIEDSGIKNQKLPHPKPRIEAHPFAASTPVSPVAPQLGALLSLRSVLLSRKKTEKSVTTNYNNVPPPASIIPQKAVVSSPKIPVPVKEPVKIDVTKFPVFPGPPRLNDLIAFKVLELSEDYSPEISEYMQGRITNVEPNGDLTVELLNPRVKRHARGKFELLENEEEEEEMEGEIEEEYETTVTYNWNQMIEPRLIFP